MILFINEADGHIFSREFVDGRPVKKRYSGELYGTQVGAFIEPMSDSFGATMVIAERLSSWFNEANIEECIDIFHGTCEDGVVRWDDKPIETVY